jgi:hypothetical protein
MFRILATPLLLKKNYIKNILQGKEKNTIANAQPNVLFF